MPATNLARAPRQAAVVATIAGLHAIAFMLAVSGLGPRLMTAASPPPPVFYVPKPAAPAPIAALLPAVPAPTQYHPPQEPEPVLEIPLFDDSPATAATPVPPAGAPGSGTYPAAPQLRPPTLRAQDGRLAALVAGCYPSASRRLGEEGRVLARLDIDAGGRVAGWNVVERSGFHRLDDAVDCVIRRLAFHPGRRDGEAVFASIDLPIVFQLD